MDGEQKRGNVLTVPMAIVIAGVIIAGAVFFSNSPSTPPASQAQQAQNQPTQPQTTESDIAVRPVSADEHALGSPTASLAVIEFSDTECPYCKLFHATMQQVTNIYGKSGKLLWVYRHFPIVELHSKAPKEAEATECVSEQGGNDAFWEFTNKIFSVTPSNNGLDAAQLPKIANDIGLDGKALTACLDSGKYTEKVQKDYEEAVLAGGRGTPFSVFVTSKNISDQTIATIKSLAATYPPDTFIFSADKHRVGMSGALPFITVQKVIDVLLASK